MGTGRHARRAGPAARAVAILTAPAGVKPAARVRLLDAASAPLPTRPYFADGDPGPIAASLAHVPDLLPAAMSFIGAALGGSWLQARTKEIVILRVSALAGCRYCTAAHTVAALDSGLTREQVRSLRGELPLAPVFDDAADLAVIGWSDAVHAGSELDLAAAHELLAAHFEDGAVVELTVCATATLMLNRYATSLALPTAPQTLSRLASEGLAG